MKLYLFQDRVSESVACFSSKEKYHDFLKKYVSAIIDRTDEIPLDEDFEMSVIECDPDFERWWQG